MNPKNRAAHLERLRSELLHPLYDSRTWESARHDLLARAERGERGFNVSVSRWPEMDYVVATADAVAHVECAYKVALSYTDPLTREKLQLIDPAKFSSGWYPHSNRNLARLVRARKVQLTPPRERWEIVTPLGVRMFDTSLDRLVSAVMAAMSWTKETHGADVQAYDYGDCSEVTLLSAGGVTVVAGSSGARLAIDPRGELLSPVREMLGHDGFAVSERSSSSWGWTRWHKVPSDVARRRREERERTMWCPTLGDDYSIV